jgi:hypothetical protein
MARQQLPTTAVRNSATGVGVRRLVKSAQMIKKSSVNALLLAVLAALSVCSVFAEDVPLNQETKVTGKLSIQKGSVFIDLPDTNIAVLDGKPATITALKKQAATGKVVTIHGVMSKMDGAGRTKYETAYIFSVHN